MAIRVLIRLFDSEERTILGKTEELYKILTHLRYEGKVSRGKNVKAAVQVMRVLRTVIKKHQDLQEKVVFPYLITHIPKHETVVQFLRADHQEMNKSRLKLETALHLLTQSNHGGLQSETGQELGVYFVCLLRHHIQLENKCVHQAIRSELRKDEQLNLKKKVDCWLAQQQKGMDPKAGPRLKAAAKKTADSCVRKKAKRLTQ